ncbi:carbamoyl-phosphate synthase small chain [Clostridia bacterium]|nr:carbamoyl-phosphate synthase small chain [Clostridia bacterium]
MSLLDLEKAYLILRNGMTFPGRLFGAGNEVIGEVVFTTGSTGYQETLTDPSYAGQLITQTFPLIGNYGVNKDDYEAEKPAASGYIVREYCVAPSNFRSEGNINDFLKANNITGICDIDTRKLTRTIREAGVMNGAITTVNPGENDISELLARIAAFKCPNPVAGVSVKEKRVYKTDSARYNIALIDYGYKANIRHSLQKAGSSVTVFPHNVTAEEILAGGFDGVMLSNGPGDPEVNVSAIETIRALFRAKTHIFGICLGHQLSALANGGKTVKLKYGHRGANQPVIDLATGKTYVTSQNHGYAVVSDSIDKNIAEVSHVNANDNTCEGIRYKNAPVMTVQFHPEARGGPEDTAFLFREFLSGIEKA